jgi:hypothetical protein
MGAVIVAAVAATAGVCTSCSGGGRSGSLEVRPVIMPAQKTTAVRADSFGSLHVPATEDAYSNLSRSRRAMLAEALRGVDCAHPPTLSGTAVRVVCDAQSYAYLLGAPIFTAGNVTGAAPIAPTYNGVTSQWRLALSLDSTGGDRMWEWTSAHHTEFPDGMFTVTQTSAKPPCGVTVRSACSDFLAYVSDGVVATVDVTFDPFRTAVVVDGAFNKASATRLAHRITG